MKRNIAILLSVVMLGTLLTGCSNKNGNSQTSNDAGNSTSVTSSPTSGADTSTDTSTEAKTLKVWIPPYAGGDAEYTDQDFWDDQFDAFEKENNCKVEVSIFPWSGYMEKITTGLSSGEGPDLIYIDTLYDLAKAGSLENLDPYFTKEEKDNYYYYNLGNVAGGQYAMPMIVGDASVLFCNMDIFKKAGIQTPPQTWDELIKDAKIIKKACPDVTYPFVQPWGNSSGKSAIMTSFLPYFWQADGNFLTEDGIPNLNSDAGKTTLNFLKSLMDEGVFDDTIVSVSDAPETFNSGQAAMVLLGSGMSGSIDKAGINWDFSTLLGPTGGKGYWISGDSLAVASNSTNKELAVKALKYMVSSKVMAEFNKVMYASAPLTKDAASSENERFKTIYSEDTGYFHIWPAFENADSFYDILFKNIQSMYMGDLKVQEVIDNTMEEYKTALQ